MEPKHDEDVLVDNAAAASLFSPNMWVQRPQARHRPNDIQKLPSAFKGYKPPPTFNQENWNQQQTDNDLQYLEAEAKHDEHEQQMAIEDMATIAAHQQLLWQWEDESTALQAKMNELADEVEHLYSESYGIRHLFKIFNVVRDDFSAFHPECSATLTTEGYERKLVETGERILAALDASAQKDQQQQAAAPAVDNTHQRKKRKAAEANTLISEEEAAYADDYDQQTTAAADLNTNQRKKRRAAEANTLIYASQEEADDYLYNKPVHTTTPAPRTNEAGVYDQLPALTPREHPQEAVVAAAALSLKQGDPGIAMLFLLQQAYKSHLESVAAKSAAVAPAIVEPSNTNA